jgi:hypothetical protein
MNKTQVHPKAPPRRVKHRLMRILAALIGLVALTCGGLYAALSVNPEIGAQGADTLRNLIGQEAVAQLETVVYGGQDQLNRELSEAGLKQAQVPWASSGPIVEAKPIQPAPLSASKGASAHPPAAVGAKAIPSTALALAPVWTPPMVSHFTTLQGEGDWLPYVEDAGRRVVAYRTFLAPDHERRYVVVGIVAIDLRAAQLHFMAGSKEPKSPVSVERSGRIPDSDKRAGKLLAVFNGGFKAEHGHFGAMVDHITLLPPIRNDMTVGLSADGGARMGVWGQDQVMTADTVSWRQNGPALIHHGQVNPLTTVAAGGTWGASIDGSVAVWRSALGLSQDGHVLYYASGDSLIVPTLARALQAAGAYDAMQLDINNYWVYFGAVKPDGDKLITEPLFDRMKGSDPRRYLDGFSRDFFYVTMREP